METASVQARDELCVTAEVVSKFFRTPSVKADDLLLASEAVTAANTLPVLASFLTNCERGDEFTFVAEALRIAATRAANIAIGLGCGDLISTYP